VLAVRARKAATGAALLLIAGFVLAGLWLAIGIDGYRIVAMPDANSAFMPVAKTVEKVSGAWFDNYRRWPATWALPLLAIGGAVLCVLFSALQRALAAFIASGVSVTCVILTAGTAMFPFVMPSSLAPNSSLTAWDAVASHKSLAIMFWVVVVMLPVICIYTSWVYRVVSGKMNEQHIHDNEHSSY